MSGVLFEVTRSNGGMYPYASPAATVTVKIGDDGAEVDWTEPGVGSGSFHLRPGDQVEVTGRGESE